MNKSLFKEYWQILALNLLAVILFIVFYGHFGNTIVDTFREAYIPTQVLQGKLLYRDIFTIYAPFSYLFNSLLFFIFGCKLKVLHIAGFLASLGILNITYLISKQLLSRLCAVSICLFLIFTALLAPNVFNIIFPYSYGMTYGLLFAILSIYFCLIKTKYQFAYLFASLALCCKYEFILIVVPLLILTKNKKLLLNVITYIIPPLLLYGIMAIHGLKINDIIVALQLIILISATSTMKWFYSISGLIFRPQIIPIYLIYLAKMSIQCAFLHFFDKWWMYALITALIFITISEKNFIFSAVLLLVLLITRFKNIPYNNRIFALFILAMSIKVFFAPAVNSYGTYFLPFILLGVLTVIPEKLIKPICIIIIASSIAYGVQNIKVLHKHDIKLQTQNGIFYADEYHGNATKELIDYINKNTKNEDKILVLPEGLIVNFMTGRQSDNKFYSLIPMYVEAFGDDTIVERFKITKPNYIVISNYDTSNYFYKEFGKDYGQKIYDYIISNYNKEASIGSEFKYTIYKSAK